MSNVRSVRTHLNMNDTNRSSRDKFFVFALWWGAFSSVIALALIKAGVGGKFVFAIKDLPIYGGGLLVARWWLNSSRGLGAVAALLGFLVFLLLNYITLNPNYVAPLNNIRQIMGPLFLLLLFCHIKLSSLEVDRAENSLIRVLFLVFVLGALEQIFGFWPTFDLTTFFELKGIPVDESGLSFMFYEPMLGGRERMTSVFIDPISLGHFFASALIYFFYKKKDRLIQWIAVSCCIAGLVMTFSKGAFLQVFIATVLLNGKVLFPIKLGLGAMAVFFVANLPNLDGIQAHVDGFFNAISSISVFGYGIGAAGNYAAMFGTSSTQLDRLRIFDTFAGAILGQIGLVGIVFWLAIAYWLMLVPAKSLRGAVPALRLFSSIFLVAVLSENTMNVTSFLIPSVLIGMLLSRSIQQSRSHSCD